ncbi:unnamed protein product [Prunus armeniaca]
MVAMQLRWEERVAMFNPSVEINFDTSGEPPSSSPTTGAALEPKPEPATCCHLISIVLSKMRTM